MLSREEANHVGDLLEGVDKPRNRKEVYTDERDRQWTREELALMLQSTLPSDAYMALAVLIRKEAVRAAGKHKPMNSHHEAHSVILEEFDEYWDLVKLNPKKPMVHPRKGHMLSVEDYRKELREELVQTAAMCLRALHDLCAPVPVSENEAFDQTAIARNWPLPAGGCSVEPGDSIGKPSGAELRGVVPMTKREATAPAGEIPPMLCEHANECPYRCTCPSNCSCRRLGSSPSCKVSVKLRTEQCGAVAGHDICCQTAGHEGQHNSLSGRRWDKLDNFPREAGENWGLSDSEFFGCERGAAPTRMNGVSFGCGCTRYVDQNRVEHITRCPNGQCTRMGRR